MRRRNAVRTAVVLVALAGGSVVAGCGVPQDGKPTEIARDSLPRTLLESPGSVSTLAPSERSTTQTIYLVRSQGTTDGLVAVPVVLPSPNNGGDLPRAVLERLISNPASPETTDLSSAIPPGLRIRSAVIRDGILELDLANLGSIESTRQRLAVAQFVYTATALPGITGVRFSIDGEPSAVPLDERTAEAGDVITRADFPKLDATVTSVTTSTSSTTTVGSAGAPGTTATR